VTLYSYQQELAQYYYPLLKGTTVATSNQDLIQSLDQVMDNIQHVIGKRYQFFEYSGHPQATLVVVVMVCTQNSTKEGNNQIANSCLGFIISGV